MTVLFIVTICLFILFLYFVPSFIAIGRKHTYSLQITLLNSLLGWSFFGWAAALIWATTDHIDENVNNRLSWIIISVFFVAILFPVLMAGAILGFSSYKLETEAPHITTTEYKIVNFKLVPVKTETSGEENKSDETDKADKALDLRKTTPDDGDKD